VLSSHFGNAPLESHLLGCSKAGIAPTLSRFVIERRADFDSADVSALSALSALSFEALDDLLLSLSVKIKIKIESEDELVRSFLNFGSGHRFLLKHIQLGFLSAEVISLLADHFKIPPESVWQSASEVIRHPRVPLDSVIISDFPPIVAEFRWKRFSLLWRSGRDGFRASQFRFRCDGHANTRTVILDTKGNIFDGYTPVAWESSSHWKYKGDESQKSFLFTLKNSQSMAARRFALKAEDKHQAIGCISECGPYFYDIAVSNNPTTDTNSATYGFGNFYTNHTGLDWTEIRFSRVRGLSKLKKSKSLRSQTTHLFLPNPARFCLGIVRMRTAKQCLNCDLRGQNKGKSESKLSIIRRNITKKIHQKRCAEYRRSMSAKLTESSKHSSTTHRMFDKNRGADAIHFQERSEIRLYLISYARIREFAASRYLRGQI
jgi:hypothetical protein